MNLSTNATSGKFYHNSQDRILGLKQSLQAIELEEAVIGGILSDLSAMARIAGVLQPEAFSIYNHNLIYSAALDLYSEGLPTDVAVVAQKLQERGQLGAIGGELHLMNLVIQCVHTASIDSYAEILNEKWHHRQIKEISTTLAGMPEAGASPEEIRDQIKLLLKAEARLADPTKRLRLDLQAVLQEANPIAKLQQITQLCIKYRIPRKDVDEMLRFLKRGNHIAKSAAIDIDALLDLESQGLNWIIPEFLPAGETIILGGDPKAGKTLLAIDAAFAIATGESTFLGEQVTRGKVLLVECDESQQSTRAKLLKRGFRRQDKGQIRLLSEWDITQMQTLEQELEDFRPEVVIIDSLRRINHGSQISENSAEFADSIYSLKEVLAQYGAAGILIHHTNKNNDAVGVSRLRGSSAIAGAVWGVWELKQIPKQDPHNKKKLVIDPKDPARILSIHARDVEGQTLRIEFNAENNSFSKIDNLEDAAEAATQETIKQRILAILAKNSHLPGLTGREIIELLGMTPEVGRGVYTELNRMVNKRLITSKPAPGDKRFNVYSLPGVVYNATENLPPPPPICDPIVEYQAGSIDIQGLDNTQQDTQQQFNNCSTDVSSEMVVDSENLAVEPVLEVVNNEPAQGGGECVETPDSDDDVAPIQEGDRVVELQHKRSGVVKSLQTLKLGSPKDPFTAVKATVLFEDGRIEVWAVELLRPVN